MKKHHSEIFLTCQISIVHLAGQKKISRKMFSDVLHPLKVLSIYSIMNHQGMKNKIIPHLRPACKVGVCVLDGHSFDHCGQKVINYNSAQNSKLQLAEQLTHLPEADLWFQPRN